MKKLLLVLAVAAAVAAPAASAGGWATVGLRSLPPSGLDANQAWPVDITVLQHGRTPLAGVTPIVRIRGRLTADGARVNLLTVRAPRGARIAVKCAGAYCPRQRIAIVAVIVHLRPYERILRAGTRLEIRVTRPSFIGKYTRIVMRQGRPPLRQDRCLMPGSSRPVICPSG